MAWLTYHRIELFLPSNPGFDTERYAVAAAEGWLRERFGGATSSTKAGPVFHGYYPSNGRWIDDQIVLIMVDTDEPIERVSEALAILHETLAGLYLAAGRTQEEFWITVTSINRYVPEG